MLPTAPTAAARCQGGDLSKVTTLDQLPLPEVKMVPAFNVASKVALSPILLAGRPPGEEGDRRDCSGFRNLPAQVAGAGIELPPQTS